MFRAKRRWGWNEGIRGWTVSCDRLFMADRDIVEVGAGDDLGYSVDGGIKTGSVGKEDLD